MLKRIFQILALTLVAWFFEPLLEILLPLPTEHMVRNFLDLTRDTDQKIFTTSRYIVWISALALIFRFTGPILNFVIPFTRRYSTSKPMRRVQGFLGEFFIIALIGVPLIVAVIPIQANRMINQATESYIDTARIITNPVPALKNVMDSLVQNRLDAQAYIRHNRDGLAVPFDTFPYETDYGFLVYLEDFEGTQYETNDRNQLAAFVAAKRKELKRERKDDGLFELASSWVNEKFFSITSTSSYKAYLRTHLKLTNRKERLDSLQQAYYQNNQLHEDATQKLARSMAWADFDDRVMTLTIRAFGKHWGWISIVALLGYVATRIINRKIIGGVYSRFMQVVDQGRFGLGGSARFATLFEEWNLPFKDQPYALLMGRSLYNPSLQVGMEDPRHMMTIAGTRAGKGATSIIPNLLHWRGSALVIDPKGTNAKVTMRQRKAMGQDVHLIDPFNVVGKGTSSFNPLEFIEPESVFAREHMSVIADALVIPSSNSKDQYWDDGARSVIAGLISQLITDPKYENPNLSTIRTILTKDRESMRGLWAGMSSNIRPGGTLAREAGNRVERGLETNEILSILSSTDRHTEWLSSPAMANVLKSSSFKFSEIKKKPTTIYLILPPEYLKTHNRFLRLFVNVLISQMSVGGKAEVPVMMMLDEFLALGKMEEVEKAFGLMAGYNFIMWPFIQDLGRLHELYGNSVNAFIANSRAVQVYGVSDKETTSFISDTIGQRSLNRSMRSEDQRFNNVVNLRPPDEVARDININSGRQYILRAGLPPLLLEKIPYYKSRRFAGLYDPDPDYE